MLRVLSILLFILYFHTGYSQCGCTDCPVHVPSNATETSTINISGALNPELGVNQQKLCKICINFFTDAIREINFTLHAPDGSTIKLIDGNGANINANMNFDICFVLCSETPEPEPGHSAIFKTTDNWPEDSDFGGTYHPFEGCLEDLTGPVDGDWVLEIEDVLFLYETDVNDWYLVFNDDSGIGCEHADECGFTCLANAGDISVNTSPACPSEIINFSLNNFNSTSLYQEYILIVDENDVVLAVYQGDTYDYSFDHCGNFKVYSYNIEIAGTATIPSVGDLVTDYDCNTNCCDLVGEPFSFEDDSPPIFTYIQENPNYPNGDDFTKIYCIDDIPDDEPAQYDDNCIGSGTVDPEITDDTDPCLGGEYKRKWEISDNCSDPVIVEQIIIIEAAPLAEFLDPPDDTEVYCNEIPTTVETLFYSNGLTNICEIEGEVEATVEDDYNACGGTITKTWSTTDECGNDYEFVQTITVNPAPMAVFLNPPNDTVVNCSDAPTTAPDLIISNSQSQSCLIEETVTPTTTTNFNGCNGEIINTWSFTDDCDRYIEYIQTITIEETDPPVFKPIQDTIKLDCGVTVYDPPQLKYSNNSSGSCLVEGYVEGKKEYFENEIIITWSLELNCTSDTLVTKQIVLLRKNPAIVTPIDTTICLGDSLNLEEIEIRDTNNTNAIITYHYNFPWDTHTLISNKKIAPTDTTIIYILLTTKDSCTTFSPFIINVEKPNPIAQNGEGIVCNGNSNYNLFDFLNNVSSTIGQWKDPLGLIINNPSKVSFKNKPPGIYKYLYFNSSGNTCNSDTATATITVENVFDILIDSINCGGDLQYYKVSISVDNDIDISTNSGNQVDLGNGQFEISNIPLTDTLLIFGSNKTYDCTNSISISPPNCNCPFIAPPISSGDIEVCIHELPVTLSVNLSNNYTASWYSNASGGTPIASETLTFIPPETLPGIYSYYVEAISLENKTCVSKTRTLVKLTIFSSPNTSQVETSTCQNYVNGKIEFDLSSLDDHVTKDSNNFVDYYLTKDDALNETNKLENYQSNPDGIHLSLFARVTNDKGCYSITRIGLAVNPYPNVDIKANPSNILNCRVQEIDLSSPKEKNTKHQWFFNGNPINNLSFTEAGEVILIAKDTVTGCHATDTINILDARTIPSINIAEADTIGCNNPDVLLDGSLSQSGSNIRYFWYNGNSNQPIFSDINKINIETGGWYFFEIVDTSTNCSNRDSIFVTELIYLEITLQSELKYSNNQQNTITAQVNIDNSEIASIEWSPKENLSCYDCLNPEITKQGITKYSITITDIYGCSSTASIDIQYNNIEIYVPNIFSPNGDGINDFFFIKIKGEAKILEMEMTIFDRWGNKVFFKENLHKAQKSEFWDGTFKGKTLNPAVFVYTYKIVFDNGKELKGVGDITIIK